jgi:hypothetical protein
MLGALAALAASGCYASHAPGWARVDGLLIDEGWLEGEVDGGDVSGVAYEIEVRDRRPDGYGTYAVVLHTGARGGADHGWAMVALDFAGVDLESLEPGTARRFDPGTWTVDTFACTGPSHGVQAWEEVGSGVTITVTGTPERRELALEVELDGRTVRGGFVVLAAR